MEWESPIPVPVQRMGMARITREIMIIQSLLRKYQHPLRAVNDGVTHIFCISIASRRAGGAEFTGSFRHTFLCHRKLPSQWPEQQQQQHTTRGPEEELYSP